MSCLSAVAVESSPSAEALSPLEDAVVSEEPVDVEVEVSAWLPHAAFHDFYRDMHAIGPYTPRARKSVIFSTQSTHKLLAGLSQASQHGRGQHRHFVPVGLEQIVHRHLLPFL